MTVGLTLFTSYSFHVEQLLFQAAATGSNISILIVPLLLFGAAFRAADFFELLLFRACRARNPSRWPLNRGLPAGGLGGWDGRGSYGPYSGKPPTIPTVYPTVVQPSSDFRHFLPTTAPCAQQRDGQSSPNEYRN
jgi:hypothetical protein